MEIFHNPRCRKSRETLALLQENGIDPDIRLYLDIPPNKKELKAILKKLNITAVSLIRKSEAIFKEKFRGKELSDEQWIDAMLEYPKLIERPIVISGSKAIIGRPPELVLTLI
ncbi:MAG: arsenate reductase [Saprospiraceae bacterium]|jgi:arsenate reductase